MNFLSLLSTIKCDGRLLSFDIHTHREELNNTFFYKNGQITMFLSKPSFSEHEFFFFRGERFAREFVAKLVYVLSAHELMSCSVVQQKAKGKKCWKRKFRMYTKKKNSVSSENSFYFLSSENK